MAAEVSSRLAACSSVRCDRSVVLVEISAEALVTSRPDALISPIVALTFSAIWPTEAAICPTSSLRPTPGTTMEKLPFAISSSGRTSSRSGLAMPNWPMTKPMMRPNTTLMPATIIMTSDIR